MKTVFGLDGVLVRRWDPDHREGHQTPLVALLHAAAAAAWDGEDDEVIIVTGRLKKDLPAWTRSLEGVTVTCRDWEHVVDNPTFSYLSPITQNTVQADFMEKYWGWKVREIEKLRPDVLFEDDRKVCTRVRMQNLARAVCEVSLAPEEAPP